MSFFKTGEDALKCQRDPETGRTSPRSVRASGVGFTETLWGQKARDFVDTTERLLEEHWDGIIEHSMFFMANAQVFDSDDENKADGDGDGDTEPLNPRAVIELD